MNKKILLFLITAGLTLNCLAVYGSSTAEDAYSPVSDEKIEVHLGRYVDPTASYIEGDSSGDNYVLRYLEEQLNVDYVFDFFAETDYIQKVAMAIASDSMPEICAVNITQFQELAEADALADLTEAYNTYASESLKTVMTSAGGIAEELVTKDGKMLGIAAVNQNKMSSIPLTFIRKDWMEELGLDAPRTIDDLVEIAKVFMEKNPGGKVTDGMVASQDVVVSNGSHRLNGFFDVYGSYPETWISQEDGTVVWGGLTQETKEALANIAQLAKEGVLDPALAVRDGVQCQEMLYNGQAGIWFGSWWSSYVFADFYAQEGSSAEFECFVLSLDETGKLKVAAANPLDGTIVVVKKGASDEIKEAVIKTLNYQVDIVKTDAAELRESVGATTPFYWNDLPIQMTTVAYDQTYRNAQAVKDTLEGKLTEEELQSQYPAAVTYYDGLKYVEEVGGIQGATDAAILFGYTYVNPIFACLEAEENVELYFPPAVTYGTTPSYAELWPQLQDLQDEFFLQVITGDADIEEFDTFVEKWKAQGGDIITEEFNEMLSKTEID